MKIMISENNDISCKFSSKSERETLFKVIRKHIQLMPKVYRKRNANWVIVKHLLGNGYGVSCAICKALNVEHDSYVWERNNYGNQ